MDHRFDYPTAAAPTSSLVFVRGAQLVGDRPRLRLNQEVEYTDGGTVRARNKGSAKRVWPLTVIVAVDSGSEADFEDLVDWIEDVAEGAVNTFQWSDSAGTVRTVRLMGNEFEWEKQGHDGYRCTLMLEVE